jgi:molybdopterin synthase catalytic subunit
MEIRVRLFATLRQLAGWSQQPLELPDGATLDAALAAIDQRYPALTIGRRTFYAAVNQEYAKGEQVLHDGDEVAIFPPVSGGEGDKEKGMGMKLFEVTDQPLSLDDAARRVTRPECGAITTFAGVVRGETVTADGMRGTDFLAYEAYTEMAETMLARIAGEIMAEWPKVAAVSILHRVGRLEIGEPSVVIAVATPHRGDGCFEACRYAIERLKAIVPIWKEENWDDGQVWVEGPRQPELAAAYTHPASA